MLVALALTHVLAAQLDPCAPRQLSLTGLDVLPPDGANDVPFNATPFVTGADLELRLVGPNGDIPTSFEDLAVVGSFGTSATLRRLVPLDDLAPGQTVTVVADGQVRSTFTVADFRDDAAPDAPAADVDDVLAGETGSCGPIQSSVTVGIASEDAAFFIGVVNGQPAIGAGVRLDGASTSNELRLFTEGAVQVNVASVDLAGNVSASVPLDVDVPKGPPGGFFGCAQASTASPADALTVTAILAPLLALSARRRRARTSPRS